MISNKIILASNSPRRADLLSQIGFSFEKRSIDFNENFPIGIPICQIPAYLSLSKSHQIDIKQNEIIITADTIVINNNKILGKPKDNLEAFKYLMSLSDATNTVITGVTLRNKERLVTFDSRTEVTFDSISKQDIQHYISKHNPLDKSGAYGIQDWIGMIGVKKINGSFYNVMGLPTHLLYKQLQDLVTR